MSDIERIRRDVSLPAIASQFGVDLEPDGQEFVACCPLHSEDTPSFTIFTGKDGVWRYCCFGCGERGDVVDFTKKIKGVSTGEAIKILGGSTAGANVARAVVARTDPYAGIARLDPIGELAAGKKIVLYNPKRERKGNITPSAVYPYRGIDGSLIGYVLRHDLPDGGKETPMVQWADVPGQGAMWCRLPFDTPRPLYGLERLSLPGQVLVVEGEKCADADWARHGLPVLSWPGGVYGVKHTDWSPLAGRPVVIEPDPDKPGYIAARNVGEILTGLKCQVRFVDILGKGLRNARDHF